MSEYSEKLPEPRANRGAEMNQYSDYSVVAKTLAHKGDPQTSLEAADKMVKSGKLSRQEDLVLRYIKGWNETVNANKFTAKNLAFCGIDYYVVQRRLSGLHNKGKIERTGEKRDGCCVWRLK